VRMHSRALARERFISTFAKQKRKSVVANIKQWRSVQEYTFAIASLAQLRIRRAKRKTTSFDERLA